MSFYMSTFFFFDSSFFFSPFALLYLPPHYPHLNLCCTHIQTWGHSELSTVAEPCTSWMPKQITSSFSTSASAKIERLATVPSLWNPKGDRNIAHLSWTSPSAQDTWPTWNLKSSSAVAKSSAEEHWDTVIFALVLPLDPPIRLKATYQTRHVWVDNAFAPRICMSHIAQLHVLGFVTFLTILGLPTTLNLYTSILLRNFARPTTCTCLLARNAKRCWDILQILILIHCVQKFLKITLQVLNSIVASIGCFVRALHYGNGSL